MKIRFRHKLTFALLHWPVRIFGRLKYGFKPVVYKGIKPPYIVLCNHVSLIDPVLVSLSFRHQTYYVASDFLFSDTTVSKAIQYLVSPIGITKGNTDIQAVKSIMSIVKQGGAVGMFPSGNTTYSGTEAYIAPATYKLIKKLKVPVVLYRTDGLYGVDPRWGHKIRRGKAIGQVQRVLSPEELSNIDEQQLCNIVRDTLQSPDNLLALSNYKSNKRAEYLERALFWCPQCNSMHSLLSSGDTISCSQCGYSATYNADLTFSTDSQIAYNKVSNWFYDQIDYVKTIDVAQYGDNPIFTDSGENLYIKQKNKTKQLVAENVTTTLYNDRLVIGDVQLAISDITGMAMQNRGRALIYTNDYTYMIIGQDRTNHYKYIVMHRHIINTITGEDNYELLGL